MPVESDPSEQWVLDHSLPEYFELPDLSPGSWDEFASKMSTSEELSIKYENMRSNGGPDTRL